GFRKLNRPSFFVGKKGCKKPPKSHATLKAAPTPRTSWPTHRDGECAASKNQFFIQWSASTPPTAPKSGSARYVVWCSTRFVVEPQLQESTYQMYSLSQKYQCLFEDFERNVHHQREEDFALWEDYLSWKGHRASAKHVSGLIQEIEHGSFTLAS
ncbi:MAG: hypothetical protein AAF399_04190, partial [Bacteroidota bacterium]